MKPVTQRTGLKSADWDTLYRDGTPPWETGRPASELLRVVEENGLRPMPILELGCGSGANAVYLARRGFDVTAIDYSPTAVERARTRAEQSGAWIRFVLDDIFTFAQTAEAFDFVFDVGLYHCLRQTDLGRFLDLLWRVTRPGTLYLTLAGSVGEEEPGGPPQVSEEEIRSELGRLFEFIHLRPCRLESPCRPEGYLGWSCLMRRPIPCKPNGGVR